VTDRRSQAGKPIEWPTVAQPGDRPDWVQGDPNLPTTGPTPPPGTDPASATNSLDDLFGEPANGGVHVARPPQPAGGPLANTPPPQQPPNYTPPASASDSTQGFLTEFRPPSQPPQDPSKPVVDKFGPTSTDPRSSVADIFDNPEPTPISTEESISDIFSEDSAPDAFSSTQRAQSTQQPTPPATARTSLASDQLTDLFEPEVAPAPSMLPELDHSAKGPSIAALASSAQMVQPNAPQAMFPTRPENSQAETSQDSSLDRDQSGSNAPRRNNRRQPGQKSQAPPPATRTRAVGQGWASVDQPNQALQSQRPPHGTAPADHESPNATVERLKGKQQAISERARRSDTQWNTVDRVLGAIGNNPGIQNKIRGYELTRDHNVDRAQRREFQDAATSVLHTAGVNVPNPRDVDLVFDMAYDELLGISVLGPFWRDDEVTEIMANGYNDIRIEASGRIIKTPVTFRDAAHLDRVSRDLARKVSDRSLSRTNPLITAELPGARVAFAYRPIVRSGVAISMRKFVPLLGMEALLRLGSLSADMADFLAEAVAARGTMLISGGTGTGKTTMVNALSEFIPAAERVVTIEDAFELTLANDHVVAMQTHERASADDETIIGQAELLIWSLRARPDRIIVGEIREGSGALVMLQAATTGHEGTMTTIHANSAEAALDERFVDLVREATTRPDDVARRSVASAIDLVIQVSRRRGRRYVSEISVVDSSCIHNGRILPEPVFVGELNPEGQPVFSKVGDVRPDTDLGKKIAEYREEVATR